jgi:hypothetical protein
MPVDPIGVVQINALDARRLAHRLSSWHLAGVEPANLSLGRSRLIPDGPSLYGIFAFSSPG